MRKLFEHPLMITLITIIAVVFMFSLHISTGGGDSGAKIIASLDETITQQRQRVEALEHQVELANDPFIQEQIQRDERLLQRPGEIILQLPPITIPPATPEPISSPLTPWEEWQKVLW